MITKKSLSEFTRVLAPKVSGTYHLDQASRDLNLDFFVMFSSIASVMGNLGQADYAAANGFMDQYAQQRNAEAKAEAGKTGQPACHYLSYNWSLWRDGGIGMDAANEKMVQQLTGVHAMQTASAMRAFHHGLLTTQQQALVLEGVHSRMTAYLQRERILNNSAAPKPEPHHLRATSAASQGGQQSIKVQLKQLLARVARSG